MATEDGVIEPEVIDTTTGGTAPVDIDAQDAAFMEAAAKADRGEEIPADILAKTETKPADAVETEDHDPTEAELADPANKDRPRDPVSGRFIKHKEDATTQTPLPKSDTTPPVLSEFEQKKQERAAKEEERKSRSWENLNREKEELARRKQELEQREQQFRQPQQQRQQPQPREFSSQQLVEASNDFRAEEQAARQAARKALEIGDYDEFGKQNDAADKAAQIAEQAYQNATEFFTLEQQEAQQLAIQQHQSVWVDNMEKSIKANPDLGKADSPIAVQVADILKTHGQLLQMLPDGFDRAVELAQLRLDAKETPTLREENKKLKAEVERLTGLTQPTPGGPGGAPPAKKTFEQMSEAEQDAYLRRQAEEHDAARVP